MGTLAPSSTTVVGWATQVLLVLLLLVVVDSALVSWSRILQKMDSKRGTGPSAPSSWFHHAGLIPSQIIVTSSQPKTRLTAVTTSSLIEPNNEQSLEASNQNEERRPPPPPRRSRQKGKRPPKKRKKPPKTQNPLNSTANTTDPTVPSTARQSSISPPPQRRSFGTTGNLPDPWHRAISMDHLRHHPHVQALPLHVTRLDTLEDVAQFRQDSWQWQALHAGRCTTSQAAAALGLLEPTAGQQLGIPPSWRRNGQTGTGGGLKAYQRLRQTPVLRTLSEFQQTLLEPKPSGSNSDGSSMSDMEPSSNNNNNGTLWVSRDKDGNQDDHDSSRRRFLADYHFLPPTRELRRRKRYIQERSGGEYLAKSLRLIWGNTQEATALLTALNYFAHHVDPHVVLEESGLRGAGLACNQTTTMTSGLLIGATPDGILRYTNPTTHETVLEVVEVKNHCPFFSNKGRKRRAGRVKAFSIGDRPADTTIPAQYVSQLQLEMQCVGPTCQSALMVRQTATQGAVLLRMPRDEAWMSEMMHFLHRFQRDFVQPGIQPPVDFFWNSAAEHERYRHFVRHTARLAHESVQLVAKIPHEDIQRVPEDMPFFLDDVK